MGWRLNISYFLNVLIDIPYQVQEEDTQKNLTRNTESWKRVERRNWGYLSHQLEPEKGIVIIKHTMCVSSCDFKWHLKHLDRILNTGRIKSYCHNAVNNLLPWSCFFFKGSGNNILFKYECLPVGLIISAVSLAFAGRIFF